jgi:hypothetical protein
MVLFTNEYFPISVLLLPVPNFPNMINPTQIVRLSQHVAVNSNWHCSQYEEKIRQYEASSVLHKLQEIPIEPGWRLESCCFVAWPATGLHEDLPFLV